MGLPRLTGSLRHPTCHSQPCGISGNTRWLRWSPCSELVITSFHLSGHLYSCREFVRAIRCDPRCCDCVVVSRVQRLHSCKTSLGLARWHHASRSVSSSNEPVRRFFKQYSDRLYNKAEHLMSRCHHRRPAHGSIGSEFPPHVGEGDNLICR